MANVRIPLSEPSLRGKEEEYVRDCITSGWVSSVGSYVDRFEALAQQEQPTPSQPAAAPQPCTLRSSWPV
jgi:dTDP-4-amino-4,6-dideoxygalactose transaminase